MDKVFEGMVLKLIQPRLAEVRQIRVFLALVA